MKGGFNRVGKKSRIESWLKKWTPTSTIKVLTQKRNYVSSSLVHCWCPFENAKKIDTIWFYLVHCLQFMKHFPSKINMNDLHIFTSDQGQLGAPRCRWRQCHRLSLSVGIGRWLSRSFMLNRLGFWWGWWWSFDSYYSQGFIAIIIVIRNVER